MVLQGDATEAICPIINHLINFSALVNVANLGLNVVHSVIIYSHFFAMILTSALICSIGGEKGIAAGARPSLLL